ncbi:MAG: cadmium-translocating P-type ATPase, partial [Rhizobiales bacterium]|nr:cadmium-translocating P-type ATPase [Hyphomicrobiales bacterium]
MSAAHSSPALAGDQPGLLPQAKASGDETGLARGVLLVPGIHCAGCIARVERLLGNTPGIVHARVNLTEKRVAVRWRPSELTLERIAEILQAEGYQARSLTQSTHELEHAEDHERRRLLRALAIAGFAAGNVMLLSVSVWSGADLATRALLHWILALIALPALVYAGQPFFASATRALKARRLNMDVPISLALILAAAISLHETIVGGEETYFDAACMLAFFLLAGRTLDMMMRARARSAVGDLVALRPGRALVVNADGSRASRDIEQLSAGMTVFVAPGERVPADGEVISGQSDVDRALITGESAPVAVAAGSAIEAGCVNLSGPLEIEVTAAGDDTALAHIVELMREAEQVRAGYMRIADRAARIYAPLVHLAALITFAGWLWWGVGWHQALLTAIAVLIITCPCALGLAVPAVQVVACGKLFKAGIMVKSGAALERLAEVDTVVFDKTGTLTFGRPQLVSMEAMADEELAIALGLARQSRHPLAISLAGALGERGLEAASVTQITEVPGSGLSGSFDGTEVRLGSREWCGGASSHADTAGQQVCLQLGDGPARAFHFRDQLREDVAETVSVLKSRGFRVALLSGDRESVVRDIGAEAGIDELYWARTPSEKVEFIKDLQGNGDKVLMVGDGLNDAAALGAAHASMAPSTAADIAGTTADLVFIGQRLGAVTHTLEVTGRARKLVRQNFA